jgi:hypothetical protein
VAGTFGEGQIWRRILFGNLQSRFGEGWIYQEQRETLTTLIVPLPIGLPYDRVEAAKGWHRGFQLEVLKFGLQHWVEGRPVVVAYFKCQIGPITFILKAPAGEFCGKGLASPLGSPEAGLWQIAFKHFGSLRSSLLELLEYTPGGVGVVGLSPHPGFSLGRVMTREA